MKGGDPETHKPWQEALRILLSRSIEANLVSVRPTDGTDIEGVDGEGVLRQQKAANAGGN